MTTPGPPHDEEVPGLSASVPGAPPTPPGLEHEEPEFNVGEHDVASDAPDPDLEPVHPQAQPKPHPPASQPAPHEPS